MKGAGYRVQGVGCKGKRCIFSEVSSRVGHREHMYRTKSAVERTRHIGYSQGQILALAYR